MIVVRAPGQVLTVAALQRAKWCSSAAAATTPLLDRKFSWLGAQPYNHNIPRLLLGCCVTALG